MKKFLSLLLVSCLCLTAFPTAALAASADFVIVNGELRSYQGSGGDVVIPDNVTSIRYQVFENCTSLTSVTIPDSVTEICNHAFRGCTDLTTVSIGNGVTTLGYGVFADCTSLTSVSIGSGITSISVSTFQGCTGLTGVTIPDGVTKIENYAFQGCTGLTGVTIPDGVTIIGNYAFSDCSGLTGVTLPDSVTTIGSYAFSDCSGLTGMTLPGNVTRINSYAFKGCTGLTSITIPDSVTDIGEKAFSGCTALASATVPSAATLGRDVFPSTTEVTVLGHYFFVNANGELRGYRGPGGDVVIPDNVTSISSLAFEGCTDLTGVTIPNSVTSIDSSAFKDCTNLTSITISDSVTEIGNYVFKGCTSLTNVNMGSGVTTIGREAFKDCTGLARVTIPDNVTSIDLYAFQGCTSLTSLTISDSVTSIGAYAFDGCTALASVTVPATTNVGYMSFPSKTKITLTGHSFTIEDGVLKGYHGAGGKVVIPNTVTAIGDYAFRGCADMTSVTIPTSVTSIGVYAFKDCTGLTSITIPDSVTSAEALAFSGCTGLVSAFVPSTLNFVFPSTTKVTWLGGNYLDIEDGVLKGYRGPGGDIVIPNSVTSIADYAFMNRTDLTGVTIPNSVTQIGKNAFSGCTGLTDVTLPNKITSIGPYAFKDCTGLTSFTIPGSLKSFNYDVFYGCTNITSVTVLPGIKEISLDLPNLSDISLPNDVENIYITSDVLREFVIPDGVTQWPTLNCPQLHKLTFPKDNWVFKGISRETFMSHAWSYPGLNEVVNCPNEFVDELIASNKSLQNNWKNPKASVVPQSARITKLSKEITAGLTTEYDKAKAISQWVSSHIKYDYDYYYEGLKDYSDVPFDPEEILDTGKAVCAGFARLTQALLVAQNIPCLYVLGWATEYHAWNLAFINGEYLWIDNTWGMNYFGLGVYAFSRDHTATSAATFDHVKGPGTLVEVTLDGDIWDPTQATTAPETVEEALARAKMDALRTQYPDGTVFDDTDVYYSKGTNYAVFNGNQLALRCSDAAFGDAPITREHKNYDDIRVGDIVQVNEYDLVVVLRRLTDGSLVVAEGSDSVVTWDRTISRETVENSKWFNVITRWGERKTGDTSTNTSTGASANDWATSFSTDTVTTGAITSVLPSAMGIAYPSTQTVSVDGKKVEFQCYALKDVNGNDTNYIKLRDLADILNGTAAQFQVGWDGNVTITLGQSYTRNGSEQQTPFSGKRNYTKVETQTLINGRNADLSAFVLTDDQGGGYTYYQLRDMGKALGFNVGWSAEKGIYLETDKPYDTNN